MNIIEEQNMNGETNPDVKGNMDAPTRPPSAKKVYTKPRLVILNQSVTASGKQIFHSENSTTFPNPAGTVMVK